MASHHVAAEIGQLARRRFGRAARLLYTSIAVEGISVLISFGLLILSVRGDAGIGGGALVVVLLVGAYYLRLVFQEIYDSAETMRRQAVLTEALGWSINSMARSEWMRKAGWNDTSRAIAQPLPDDYYATQDNRGGKRLARMTAESAFYARNLYGKVRPWLLGALLSAVGLVIVGFVTVSLRATSDHVDAVIAQTVYLLVPLVVSWDLFGWW